MFKSSVQSRCWTNRPSVRVVQPAALLFKEMPRCLSGGSAKTVTPRTQRFDLLRVALLATNWKSAAEVDASGHPHKGALRATRYDGGSPNGAEPFRCARRATRQHGVHRAVSNCRFIDSPNVGACPTTLITMSQPVYVCESPAEVKRKLEAVK